MDSGNPSHGRQPAPGLPPRSSAERRQALTSAANPAPWHDYRIGWTGTLADGSRLAVDLVPDRLVLTPEAFERYLEALDRQPWPALEALATAVVDDLSNELVPRWVRVAASRDRGRVSQQVVADDRQPDWDHPGLLVRLGALPAQA